MPAQYFNISDWPVRTWETPNKGTRQQTLLEHPKTGIVHYFKQSSPKYASEFWSEIIASKVGTAFGFNVLDYNVANFKGQLGCLSQNMLTSNTSMLYHGVDILNDFIADFRIINKPVHSYQQVVHICQAVSEFSPFIDKFIDMIILDAVVGNTDRHTENWAFIIEIDIKIKDLKIKPELALWPTIRDFFKNVFVDHDKHVMLKGKINLETKTKYSFAPIYDTGSCLGREIQDTVIPDMLKDQQRLEAYINRSKHEICWYNQKLNCFELLKNILNIAPVSVKNSCKRIFEVHAAGSLNTLVDSIDSKVDEEVAESFITLQRKELIKKLLDYRIERLKRIVKLD